MPSWRKTWLHPTAAHPSGSDRLESKRIWCLLADGGRPATGSIHQNVGIWFVDQTIDYIPWIILHPRFLFSWLIPCIHGMRLSDHSHQISMPPSQTFKSCKFTPKKMGDLVQMISKRQKTGWIFRSQEVPGVALRVAQPHGSWYPSVHSWHAVPKRWQRYDVVGSPGSGENPPGNFATTGKTGKMDLVQPCFFQNSAGNNGFPLDEPMDGRCFLGILVEGREGGPNRFWSWRFVTATIYQVWDQQHVAKKCFTILAKGDNMTLWTHNSWISCRTVVAQYL